MQYYRPVLTPIAARAKRAIYPIAFRGDVVECCCCGRSFAKWVKKENGTCPRCASEARHRALWIYLKALLDNQSSTIRDTLHFAPEQCLRSNLKQARAIRYVTTDLERRDVDVNTDITRMSFEDESFDLIINSHVLEHIPDDRAAMREMYRVLRSGAVALVQVPGGTRESTYEDESITDPELRLKHFNQRDHVRIYGMDIAKRLEDAGFIVDIHFVTDGLGESESARQGLWRDPIYHCTKPIAD
jgi:SAM-dependent methyltransferase